MAGEHVLIVGGTGLVGRELAKALRARHPDLPLLVGSRRPEAAAEFAATLGGARAATVDLGKRHLGLADASGIAAVAVVAPDNELNGLAFTQDLGVPYLNVATGIVEAGSELALVAHRAAAAPVILASHWMGGAALFLALDAAGSFDRVEAIEIGTVIDEKDPAGPVALEDMERLHGAAPATLVIRNGRREWLSGAAAAGEVRAVDGRRLAAQPFSSFDIVSAFAATGAPNIRFDIVTGASSSRLRGGPVAMEIVVELRGTRNGREDRARATLEFDKGEAALTGFSYALLLSAALGLDGRPPVPAGLYLPELLMGNPDEFLTQLEATGAAVVARGG